MSYLGSIQLIKHSCEVYEAKRERAELNRLVKYVGWLKEEMDNQHKKAWQEDRMARHTGKQVNAATISAPPKAQGKKRAGWLWLH